MFFLHLVHVNSYQAHVQPQDCKPPLPPVVRDDAPDTQRVLLPVPLPVAVTLAFAVCTTLTTHATLSVTVAAVSADR